MSKMESFPFEAVCVLKVGGHALTWQPWGGLSAHLAPDTLGAHLHFYDFCEFWTRAGKRLPSQAVTPRLF